MASNTDALFDEITNFDRSKLQSVHETKGPKTKKNNLPESSETEQAVSSEDEQTPVSCPLCSSPFGYGEDGRRSLTEHFQSCDCYKAHCMVCDFEGTRKELEQHLLTKHSEPVTSERQESAVCGLCKTTVHREGKQTMRVAMSVHYQQCAEYPVACPFCCKRGGHDVVECKRGEYQKHLEDKHSTDGIGVHSHDMLGEECYCGEFAEKRACPLGCGTTVVAVGSQTIRTALAEHYALRCDNYLLQCPFVKHGCPTESVLKKDLAKHWLATSDGCGKGITDINAHTDSTDKKTFMSGLSDKVSDHERKRILEKAYDTGLSDWDPQYVNQVLPSDPSAPRPAPLAMKKKADPDPKTTAAPKEQKPALDVAEIIAKSGGNAFRYSKICIVGEGRAGKSGLKNALLGKSYEETTSTTGVDEYLLEVNAEHVVQQTDESGVDGTRWGSYDRNAFSQEADAHARAVARARTGKGVGDDKGDNDIHGFINKRLSQQKKPQKPKVDPDIQKAKAKAKAANPSKDPNEPPGKPKGTEGKDSKDPAGGAGASTSPTQPKSAEPKAKTPAVGSGGGGAAAAAKKKIAPKELTEAEKKAAEEKKAAAAAAAAKAKEEQAKADEEKKKRLEAEAAAAREKEKTVKVDEALVLRYSKHNDGEGPIRLTLWDFGGQSVFYTLHHLFLNRFGVYLVTFDMRWLLPQFAGQFVSDSTHEPLTAEQRIHECLAFLKFWVRSIETHASDASSNEHAPIFFVGTHKDMVPDPKDHMAISKIIYDNFAVSLPSIQPDNDATTPTGKGVFWFFPVDNCVRSKQGHGDPTIVRLMVSIEAAIEREEYIKKKVPFAWLALVDRIVKEKRAVMSLKDFEAVAKECGMPSAPQFTLALEVQTALHFLNGLGIVMYHPQPTLAHVVVLNPAEFLIAPATKIICRPEMHVLPEHEAARKSVSAWRAYRKHGIVNAGLIDILWQSYEHQDELCQLMCKFGLQVPLAEDNDDDALEARFLVPAILPEASATASSELLQGSEKTLTCYLLFANKRVASDWERITTLDPEMIINDGFLPEGFFARLVGKAVGRAQMCGDTAIEVMTLHRNVAELSFGIHRFALVSHPNHSCIQVRILLQNPFVVMETLQALVEEVIEESLPNLQAYVAVPVDGGVSQTGQQSSTDKPLSKHVVLMHGKHGLMPSLESGKPVPNLVRHIGNETVLKRFAKWLPPQGLADQYHAFLSYRWGEFDSGLTEAIFYSSYRECVGTEQMSVFWDRKRLGAGSNFVREFMSAMHRSDVVVPVVSASSLQKMLTCSPDMVDNVLLEWTLALELAETIGLAVYPVMMGEPISQSGTTSAMITNLFEVRHDGSSGKRLMDALPNRVNTAVVDEVSAFLDRIGVKPTTSLQMRTVKQTVEQMLKFLGLPAWDHTASHGAAAAAAPLSNSEKKALPTLEAIDANAMFIKTLSRVVTREMLGVVQTVANKKKAADEKLELAAEAQQKREAEEKQKAATAKAPAPAPASPSSGAAAASSKVGAACEHVHLTPVAPKSSESGDSALALEKLRLEQMQRKASTVRHDHDLQKEKQNFELQKLKMEHELQLEKLRIEELRIAEDRRRADQEAELRKHELELAKAKADPKKSKACVIL